MGFNRRVAKYLFQREGRAGQISGLGLDHYTIAASDTIAVLKEQANRVCSGTADEATIKLATDDTDLRCVRLMPGTYTFSNELAVLRNSLDIQLMSGATVIAAAGYTDDNLIKFGDGSTAYTNVGVSGAGKFTGCKFDGNDLVKHCIQFTGPMKQCYTKGLEITNTLPGSARAVDFLGVDNTNRMIRVDCQDMWFHDTAEGVQAFWCNYVKFDDIFANDIHTVASQDLLEFSMVNWGTICNCILVNPGNGASCIDCTGASGQNQYIIINGNQCILDADHAGPNEDEIAIVIRCDYSMVVNNIINGKFLIGIDYAGKSNIIGQNMFQGIETETANTGKAIQDSAGTNNRVLVGHNIFDTTGVEAMKFSATSELMIDANIFWNPANQANAHCLNVTPTATEALLTVRDNLLASDNTNVNRFLGNNTNWTSIVHNGNVTDGNELAYLNQPDGSILTLADDATPSVQLAYNGLCKTGGTTGITDFDDGYINQHLYIHFEHTVQITHNASNIQLAGDATYTFGAGDTLHLVMIDNGVWQEVARTEAV